MASLADAVSAANATAAATLSATPRPPSSPGGLPALLPPFFRQASSTLSPGHAAILEMHANSQSNALIYVLVVLALYVLGMSIVVIKYVRGAHDEARLTRLFHDLMQRDRFFRMSSRRSSLPKGTPVGPLDEDLPLSPILNIPEIITPPENGKDTEESNV